MRRLVLLVSAALAATALGVVSPTAPAAEVLPGTGAEDLVVAFDGGSVVVEQSPLRVRVRDASGQEVLASVADDPPATPQPRLPVPDPFLGGADVAPAPLYAPLTFVVGVDRPAQYPASFWNADVLLGVQGGVEHALTDVVGVERRDDGGVDLEVATTDPTRTAQVTVAPDADGLGRLRVDVGGPEVSTVAASWATGPDEAFHGFGGRRDQTDQRGSDFHNWLEQFQQLPEGLAPVGAAPTLQENYQFPSGPESAYYVHTAFVSSRPYAFWLEADVLSRFRLASDREDAWHSAAAGDALQVVVAPGDGPTAVEHLTAVTGRHRVPPSWTLGPQTSRAIEPNNPDLAGGYYADKLDDDLDTVDELDPPLTSIFYEGWPLLQERDELEQFTDRVLDLGLHPIGYLKAFTGAEEGGYEQDEVFTEALEQGLVATTPDGSAPYLFGGSFVQSPAALVDITDPEAQAWFRERVRELTEDLRFDAFMQDFGEQAFVDMRFHDGSTGAETHNRFPRLYHANTRPVIDEVTGRHPDRQLFYYVRSGYLGRPGSAAYEGASWSGDNTADYSRASGLGAMTPDMLNRGLTGSYGFVGEIGGYIDAFGEIDDELFTRWSQHDALVPVHRLHGHPVNGTQQPWSFSDEAYDEWLESADLHQRAQPLITELWVEATRTGAPIARPLWWHHPDDDEARAQDQQWLLGPDVLVAPVVLPGVRAQDVYFPDGCWTHGETGEDYRGPGTTTVPAPLDSLPWFTRCGTDPLGDAAVRRVAGEDRVATSLAVADERPGWGVGSALVVARSDDYADALAGAPLAARETAALALSGRERLDPRVAEEITRRGVDEVVLLGGTAALSQQVEDDVAALGVDVRRVGGADRYATAALIAQEVAAGSADGTVDGAYVVVGTDPDPRRGWPDAMSVGPLAAYQGRPVLLVGPGGLPASTRDALASLELDRVTVVGGTSAVSVATAAAVGDVVGTVERVSGADRYATSAAVAARAVEAGMEPDRVWLARGDDFPDSLAAGPVVAADAGVLLLVPPDGPRSRPGVTAALADGSGEHPLVRLLGGERALAPVVEDQVRDLVRRPR